MNRLNLLAEARIREWRSRKQGVEEQAKGARPRLDTEQPLEVSLWKQIVELRTKAKTATNATDREALRKRAGELETQLMVLLETTGRPLAARRLAEHFSRESQGSPDE